MKEDHTLAHTKPPRLGGAISDPRRTHTSTTVLSSFLLPLLMTPSLRVYLHRTRPFLSLKTRVFSSCDRPKHDNRHARRHARRQTHFAYAPSRSERVSSSSPALSLSLSLSALRPLFLSLSLSVALRRRFRRAAAKTERGKRKVISRNETIMK